MSDVAPLVSVSRKKKSVFAIITTAFVVLLVLGAGELILRLFYKKIDHITGVAEWNASVSEEGEQEFEYNWDLYHPRYGWTNAPNYRSDARAPYQVRINGQGLRADREYTPYPAKGIKRIAVFGDSCTFGEEVENDQTLPSHLELRFKDTEVLNFGVHSYGLGQMCLRMEEEAFAFHPDHIVVVLLIPPDIIRDFIPNIPHSKPAFVRKGSELKIGNTPVPVASQFPWIYRHSFAAAWLFARPREWPPEINVIGIDEAMKVAHAIVRRIQVNCEAHDVGVTIAIIIFNDSAERYSWDGEMVEKTDGIRHSLAEAEIDVVDLTEFLVDAVRKNGASLAEKRGHWSGRGNCLIAEQLAQHLAQQFPAWKERLVPSTEEACDAQENEP